MGRELALNVAPRRHARLTPKLTIFLRISVEKGVNFRGPGNSEFLPPPSTFRRFDLTHPDLQTAIMGRKPPQALRASRLLAFHLCVCLRLPAFVCICVRLLAVLLPLSHTLCMPLRYPLGSGNVQHVLASEQGAFWKGCRCFRKLHLPKILECHGKTDPVQFQGR